MKPRIVGLTLWQPWAWAIVKLDKRIENRTWSPPDWLLGGWLAIHAGKGFDAQAALDLAAPDHLPTSAIVGVARVVGVVRDSDNEWFCGPVGWVLDSVVPMPEPIQVKGAQRLWDLPNPVLAAVREGFRTTTRRDNP